MLPTTPTGWRMVSQSMAVATPSRMLPCIIVGTPHAASMFSIERDTSACASGYVLPISRVIVRGDVVGAVDERLPDVVEPSRALDHRHLAPGLRRLLGGAGGVVELVLGGQRHAGQHVAGGGVRDVEVVAAGRVDPAASDVVAQGADPGLLGGGNGGAHQRTSPSDPGGVLAAWYCSALVAGARGVGPESAATSRADASVRCAARPSSCPRSRPATSRCDP